MLVSELGVGEDESGENGEANEASDNSSIPPLHMMI